MSNLVSTVYTCSHDKSNHLHMSSKVRAIDCIPEYEYME